MPDPVGLWSGWRVRAFTFYVRHYMRLHFAALRVARDGLPPDCAGRPLLIYTNHPSWWDPIVFFLLMDRLFRGRRGFGPMEAESARQYRIFRRLGVFGIALDRRAGAADFLRLGAAILSDPRHVLWVTAQGRFCDVREPLMLRPGIVHLARRTPGAMMLPMAMDYPFWAGRKPEMLVRFGPPQSLEDAPRDTHLDRLRDGLATAMARLRDDAVARDPVRFHRLLPGR